MAKWVCPVCGYVYEGENPPEKCPQCGVPGAKFLKQGGGLEFVAEHHVGDGIVDDAEVTQGLKDHFNGECCEVGMYLAMSRQADREGYPEVAEAYKRIAFEEAEHAAKFAELLGKTIDIVTDSTKENLRRRMEAECGATAGKLAIAKRAKELGYDAIHDTVHEMAKDEARHGKAFQGLYNRYFKYGEGRGAPRQGVPGSLQPLLQVVGRWQGYRPGGRSTNCAFASARRRWRTLSTGSA